uniref:Uncharacterized protein n=1 Tax=Romanomermis culicivorax TaxID=13658 RepID=A0A915L7X2_ROMCU
ERAPKISDQELAAQLGELKGTVEALFDVIGNALTEDNKREADSRPQELDRQIRLCNRGAESHDRLLAETYAGAGPSNTLEFHEGIRPNFEHKSWRGPARDLRFKGAEQLANLRNQNQIASQHPTFTGVVYDGRGNIVDPNTHRPDQLACFPYRDYQFDRDNLPSNQGGVPQQQDPNRIMLQSLDSDMDLKQDDDAQQSPTKD